MVFQTIPRLGSISVVLASKSTLVPRGPLTFQSLVSCPVMRTSSMLRIILGKLDQYEKMSCKGAWSLDALVYPLGSGTALYFATFPQSRISWRRYA